MAIDPKILASVLQSRKAEIADRQAEIAQRKQFLFEKNEQIAAVQSELLNTMTKLSGLIFSGSEDIEKLVNQIRDRNQELLKKRGQLLEKAGYPADYLSDTPTCNVCGDSLYKDGSFCECVVNECIRLQNKELSSLINVHENKFSNFRSDYYSDKNDENYFMSPRENMEYIYSRCTDFVKDFKNPPANLLFRGMPGLGKTFLAGCIAHEISQLGYSVVYDTAVNIFSCMEHSKFGNSDEQNELQLKRITVCDLLIIDDLGTEMQTSFTVSAFYSLMNSRLTAKLPTIVITALAESEIRRRYGAQNASRLLGEFYPLNFFGDDIREQKRQGLIE